MYDIEDQLYELALCYEKQDRLLKKLDKLLTKEEKLAERIKSLEAEPVLWPVAIQK